MKQQFNIKQGIKPTDIKMTDRALGRPAGGGGGELGRGCRTVKRDIRGDD